ncbi:MAG: ribulose-phosphate 3-epimerase, partial [Candidatus Latescibacterota bacterium]|nr:ribulose-phosphate 3-epimerase [Candidatus Latescibacterota bacterium]
YLEPFKAAGADSLTIHIETCPQPTSVLRTIRTLELKCGLVLNPSTPVEKLLPYLGEIDLVLVMSVEPGFGGQSFQPQALQKVEALRNEIEQQALDLPIQIDGGVNPHTAAACRSAGASILVAGSAVFRAADPSRAIADLRA